MRNKEIKEQLEPEYKTVNGKAVLPPVSELSDWEKQLYQKRIINTLNVLREVKADLISKGRYPG